MPVVNVDPDELRGLVGTDKSADQLKEDLFGLGLEFEGETDEGELQFEFEADRLDRLSVEGVARSLRYQYGDARGVYVPSTNDADWAIEVAESVPDERPCVTGAVVRDLDLDGAALESLIQLQEKLHATMGRTRAKGAIGVHDLTMLKGAAATGADEDAAGGSGGSDRDPTEDRRDGTDDRPPGERGAAPAKSITYRGVAPDGDRFVPLESDQELTPGEVLTEHPTGEEYADLVADLETVPAIYDDIGLFSFPPVINGRRTEVTTDTRDLFVELTGTDQWTIDKMLAIVCYALDARGGQIEEVAVEYPDATLVRPDLSTKTKTVTHERVETTLGVELTEAELVDRFERSGLDAERTTVGDDELAYDVTVPPYRVDVLHPVDLVDDVGRAHGFNELVPTYPDVSTIGGRTEASRHEEAVRTALVGLGFEDLLNFNLASRADTFDRMGVEPGTDVLGGGEPAVIAEPYSEDYEIVRTWALPSVLTVLENNTHRAYPQDLAEVGFAGHVDESVETKVAERRTVAGALARHDASFEDAKARLAALADRFGTDLATPPTDHPSFVDGRTAAVELDGERAGVLGELHPRVLVEHDLELPVAAFEFDLAALR
ncbi:MAG: phenylalanine--tRNA ligase subunit beta [Halobacteriaceae archaeon]